MLVVKDYTMYFNQQTARIEQTNATVSVNTVPRTVKISAGFGNMADSMQAFLNAQAYIKTLYCRICGNKAKLQSRHVSGYYCNQCGMIEGITTNNLGADQ